MGAVWGLCVCGCAGGAGCSRAWWRVRRRLPGGARAGGGPGHSRRRGAAGDGRARGRPAPPGTGPRTRGEDTAPVGAGPAQGLLLPGPDDEVWKAVPLYLSQNLRMLAHRLVTPEQAVLRERGNHHVRYALRAAGSKRMTGRHWLVLLAAPRSPSAARAARGRTGSSRSCSRWWPSTSGRPSRRRPEPRRRPRPDEPGRALARRERATQEPVVAIVTAVGGVRERCLRGRWWRPTRPRRCR